MYKREMRLRDSPSTKLVEVTFTIADFDALGQLEKSAESLSMQERTVGRRVRLDDGKELLMMGADDFDDVPDW